ncbi:MAG TPA: tetratricopeptide repeat protein [Bryobacteraceae bacterium]
MKSLTRLYRVVFPFAALPVLVMSAFCQAPAAAPAAKKPLRERLLERALKGDAEAQFDLAKGYEGGRMGLPQDLVQAAHWYREAANQGDPFAQASLGIFYNMGKGVDRDYLQSYLWFAKSASHLTGSDRDSVVEMRDSVGRKLTAQQVAEAKRILGDMR